MKKRVIPICYIISIYIFICTAIINKQSKKLFYLTAILGILNMIYPFIMLKNNEDSRKMLFWDMILKICIVPVDIMVFIIGMTGTIFGFLFGGFVIGIIGFLINYFFLLSTSIYGMCGVIAAVKEKKISTMSAVINIIMHFCFCLDILSAISSYCKSRKNANN